MDVPLLLHSFFNSGEHEEIDHSDVITGSSRVLLLPTVDVDEEAIEC